MTTHDQATRWRDVASELTDKQVQYLEKLERRHGRNEALLLPIAREYAQSNLAERILIGDVAEPDGATFVGGWEQDSTGEWFRDFDGETWHVGSVRIAICGRQSSDGVTVRTVSVYGSDDAASELNAAQLRQLIAALTESEKRLETPSELRPRQESNLRPRD